MAWLPGYAYRKPLVLTGGASGAQTYFQLDIDIAYVAAKMQADFDDIRFTQNNGTTLIDAWLESKVDSTSAKTCTEFPTTPANTVNHTYYMYYGNAGAASDWDGAATFPELFDDFADGNYTGWSITSVSGDTVSASTYEMTMVKGGTNGYFFADRNSTSQLSTKYNWDFLIEYDNGKRINLIFNGDNANLTQGAVYLAFDSNGIRYYDGSMHTICAMSADTKYKCVVVPDVATDTFDIYVYLHSTGAEVSYSGAHTGLNFRNNATYLNQYRFNEYSANTDGGAFDNVCVRKYAANPPTYAFGSEESAPTGAAPMGVLTGCFGRPFGGII